MRLRKIHFVGAILGKIYLAAEFIDGLIRHYWLQDPPVWKPNTIYMLGELVQPTTLDGYYYQAPVSSPIPAWQPNKVYAVGAKVQPTTANGYYYLLVDATGDAPTSGDTEPVWPVQEGAQVFETEDSTDVPSTATPTAASGINAGIGNEIVKRYDLDQPT